jgi:hypothetical protein
MQLQNNNTFKKLQTFKKWTSALPQVYKKDADSKLVNSLVRLVVKSTNYYLEGPGSIPKREVILLGTVEAQFRNSASDLWKCSNAIAEQHCNICRLLEKKPAIPDTVCGYAYMKLVATMLCKVTDLKGQSSEI